MVINLLQAVSYNTCLIAGALIITSANFIFLWMNKNLFQDAKMSVAAYLFFCFSSKRSTNLIFQKVILFCFSVLH